MDVSEEKIISVARGNSVMKAQGPSSNTVYARYLPGLAEFSWQVQECGYRAH